MYKKLQYFSLFIFMIGSIHSNITSFYFGSIKSTKGSVLTPIPYYYRGNSGLLAAQKDLITFEIPADPKEKKVYLLVTDLELLPVPEQSDDGSIIFNTFQHLEISRNATYRFFAFERSDDGKWTVCEERLSSGCAIPNQTIVLLYFPELISHIEGGSLSELPTVFIDPLPYAKEENSLHLEITERLLKMHMGAINLNTIHTPVKHLLRHNNNKILIAHYV